MSSNVKPIILVRTRKKLTSALRTTSSFLLAITKKKKKMGEDIAFWSDYESREETVSEVDWVA